MSDRDDFYGDSTIWDHEFCGPDDDCDCNGYEEAEDEVENGWDPANPTVPAEEARRA